MKNRIVPIILLLFIALAANAHYATTPTENIPTARLISNMEKRLAAKPKESNLIRPGEEIQIWSRNKGKSDGNHTVQPDGHLNLPGFGKIKAAGRTLNDLKNDLNKDNESRTFARQSWQQRKGRLLPGETARLHYELARVHSIASHNESKTFPAIKGGDRPFLGYGAAGDRPPRSRRNHKPVARNIAQQHLEQAIKHFQISLKLKKDYLPAQIGLAWCFDQLGKKQQAIQHYRQALKLAWAKEGKEQGIFELSWTREVASYLEPLLDPVQDAAELRQIAKYREEISRKPRAITPIVVPLLDHAPLHTLVNPKASVPFDLDGSSLDRRWGWITPSAAWLVHDPNQSGQITSGLQLFGNVTFWIFWNNGYEPLNALDDNGDGSLTLSELDGLALWHDHNSNGISDDGEVTPVKQANITAISTQASPHPSGILFSPDGITLQDGTIRPTYDWIAPSHQQRKPQTP